MQRRRKALKGKGSRTEIIIIQETEAMENHEFHEFHEFSSLHVP